MKLVKKYVFYVIFENFVIVGMITFQFATTMKFFCFILSKLRISMKKGTTRQCLQ